jgi:uncharacterized protein
MARFIAAQGRSAMPARSGRLLSVLAAAAIAYACGTVNPHLPAITDAPTGQHIAGKIVWHDLITHTPEASKRFYGELFGWEFEDLGLEFGRGRAINYTLIKHDGHLIGGMIDANQFKRPNPAQLSQWVVVMSVADVDAAVAAARTAGGKVLTAPADVAERGRIAVIEDPQGARAALLTTRDGDPPDRMPRMGDFLWDEVWTGRVASALDFYAGLAPVKRGARQLASGREYHYVEAGGVPRYGVIANPLEGLKPTWASYVRVEDVGAVTARVAALGGKVLVEPRARDLGGQVALIADPSGAGIAIQTWSPGPATGSGS